MDMDGPPMTPIKNEDIRFIKELKSGSFGRCAVGELLERRSTLVVVKAVKDKDWEREKKWFAREARILKTLNHDNIVRFINLFVGKINPKDEEDFGIVMEYCEYGDLNKLLKAISIPILVDENHTGGKACENLSFPVYYMISAMNDVAKAFQYIHKEAAKGENVPIVHSDLALDNIFITKTFCVKVADFGLAKLKDESAEDSTLTYSKKGRTERVPPERHENPCLKSDIFTDRFQYGITCFEAFTSEFLRSKNEFVDKVKAHEAGSYLSNYLSEHLKVRKYSLLVEHEKILERIVKESLCSPPDKRLSFTDVLTSFESVFTKKFRQLVEEDKQKLKPFISSYVIEMQSNEGARKVELREYQKELSQKAVEGKNVVIYAPTGTGKTIVAIDIAIKHLQQNDSVLSQDRKVLFLVNRLNLVKQQSKLFLKYVKEYRYNVIDLSGGNNGRDRLPLSKLLKDHHIFVMTAEILLNALEKENLDDRIDSIGEFSLVIFDECHHCQKDDVYVKIMNHYFHSKARKLNLPQIVGLTASPGTDKACKTEEARKHIMKLCANLDAHNLVTVQNNVSDLEIHLRIPDAEIIYAKDRAQDFMHDKLTHFMGKIEEKLKDLAKTALDHLSSEEFSNVFKHFSAPANREYAQYNNFIGNLLKNLGSIKDEYLNHSIFTSWYFLKFLNIAVVINKYFHAHDAKTLLRRKTLDTPSNDAIEDAEDFKDAETAQKSAVAADFQNNLQKILDSPELTNEIENPLLKSLRDQILQQFNADLNSRLIVFVKERNYIEPMKIFIDNDSSLKDFGSIVISGANASAESNGITKTEQSSALKEFESGRYKILIATSVVEEGLDVPRCNMVIRFAYVTNEISTVQIKGRARAPDSKYIVLIPISEKNLGKKEETNKHRNDMMKDAIKTIVSTPEESFKSEILDLQKKKMNRRDIAMALEERNKSKKKKVKSNKLCYQLVCISCRAVACVSTDLRLIDKKHLVCIKKDKKWSSVDKPKNVVDITCSKCAIEWGKMRIYEKVKFASFDVTAFLFEEPVDQPKNRKNFKSCKEACEVMEITEIKQNEIMECLELFD